MKRILLLSLCSLSAHATFEFVSNKTVDGYLDAAFLKKMAQNFDIDSFIETGTYNGITASRAAQAFKEVHTIELEPNLFMEAQDRLKVYPNVTVYYGNSSDLIPVIVPQSKGRPLFWLDAHYSGEKTAMSNPDPNSAEAITAIRRELAAIKKSGITDCVLLIDDIRGYGSCINGVEYLGCWAYPAVQKVCKLAREINPRFSFALLGDSLLAYDADKHAPKFSSIIQACTKSRLYDGTNLSEQQLLETEQVIRQAVGEERGFIQHLYHQITDCNDPLFHHDLWYGLVCLSTDKKEAEKAFLKLTDRNQPFDTKRTTINKKISYHHPRIKRYLQEARS